MLYVFQTGIISAERTHLVIELIIILIFLKLKICEIIYNGPSILGPDFNRTFGQLISG